MFLPSMTPPQSLHLSEGGISHYLPVSAWIHTCTQIKEYLVEFHPGVVSQKKKKKIKWLFFKTKRTRFFKGSWVPNTVFCRQWWTTAWHLPLAPLSAIAFHNNTEMEMNNRTECLAEKAVHSELSATLHYSTLSGSQQGSGTLIIGKLKGLPNILDGQSS